MDPVIYISEAETSELIKRSSREGPLDLKFGGGNVWLANTPRNLWAMRELKAMREAAQYAEVAHEHDL